MRNIILVALLIALFTVVGCKEKAQQPAENTMNSMDTQSMDAQSMDTQPMDSQPMDSQPMDAQSMEAEEKPKKELAQSSETMEEPAAATEAPAGGDAAGDAAGTPQ